MKMDEESDEETEEEENHEDSSVELRSSPQHDKMSDKNNSTSQLPFSAKLDISDYTRQMEEVYFLHLGYHHYSQIIASSLAVPVTKPLLPTEEYVQQQPDVQDTPKVRLEVFCSFSVGARTKGSPC